MRYQEEFKGLNVSELYKKVRELRQQSVRFRMSHSANYLKDVSQLSKTKKKIAQALTLISQMQRKAR